jgi:NitT/TauT family transport system ATP-binding protein
MQVNGTARIRVEGVKKQFGALQVFEGVDLEIGEAEVVSIVGPSGCGKTTLLRVIGGLLPASGGTVTVNGSVVTDPPEGVAVVFQHFGLFPWKNVYDNVAYGLKMSGMSRAEIAKRIPHFIELVGLSGFEKSFPYQLSGGMQQRAGLARALATNPNVLLMDEPFGALDAQTRELLQFELLRIWNERPTSMLFVTHAIDEAVLMGHRVVILKGRPSSVSEVVEVDLPWPRDRSTTMLPRFHELKEHVWSQLMGEAARAEREKL